MTTAIRQKWRIFRRSPPGRRFQDWYQRRQRKGPGPLSRRVMRTAAGAVILFAGLVMLITPGPGWLTIFLGAAILAEESLIMARALDRLELWVRAMTRSLRLRWQRARWPLRSAYLALPGALLGASAYLSLRWLLA